jgi:DNA-binding protein HU-beta
MVNKASLMRSASKTTGLSLRDTAACIDSVIKAVNEALSRGERIELRGFGTFDVRKIAARKTDETFFDDVPAHGRIVFRPCQKLRESVWNKAGAHK